MHKLNLNADDNSIDFDFFETDEDRLKPSVNETKYSSKIITKAVIETKPNEMSKNSTMKTLKLNTSINQETAVQTKNDCILSPTSSEEKRLLGNALEDITLFNCLAYNDVINDRQMFNIDDKYFSDNSLSDSTITTVTSDFTTVSHLSSMSDSSCGSELSTDLSTPQTGELITNDHIGNFSDNTEDLNIELSRRLIRNTDESNNSENLIVENDNCIESVKFKDEYQRDDHNNQSQGINSTTDCDEESISNKTDCAKINTEIHSDNMFEEETTKENQEFCHSRSISRKESASTIDLEERIGGISLASQSSSNSSNAKAHNCKGQNRFRSKRKELNLTFSREELIRIERDNTILLKKIMAYSKPRSVLLNHAFSHKKTSAAINRARQQKKIEQDNYILYSKINAMNRMKKVF